MPYVNVPNDLSKVKTKIAFNLTKRQLVCFGGAALVGVPSYLLARSALGNTAALFLMLGIMLPAFLLAMYEKDGLPLEKVVKNIIRTKYLRPGVCMARFTRWNMRTWEPRGPTARSLWARPWAGRQCIAWAAWA